MKEMIKAYYQKEIEVIDNLNYDEIVEAVNAIVEAYEREATIYICGNGGSAATASHFVNDFNKGISESFSKKFKFVCLNDNISMLTAVANDISYDEVFKFPLMNKLKNTDLLVCISGSGNSKNIINVVKYAKEIGCKVIGITGFDGGKLKGLSDYNMHVEIQDMQITEDIHMSFDHMMYSVLKNILNKESRR